MNNFLVKQWEEYKEDLREVLSRRGMAKNYTELVRLTFSIAVKLLREDDDYSTLNVKKMTEIDDGNYQGTLIFIIPTEAYQPTRFEYLITHVSYGSCSGCDTLLSTTEYSTDTPNEEQLDDLMTLCLHLVQNAKQLYEDLYE